MKKPIAILIAIMLTGVLVNSILLEMAQASTEVKGIIVSDTVWTKANSPYKLTGPVAVNSGVTLTVEPGVTVNLKYDDGLGGTNYYIQVNGTLIAKGSSSEPIHFNGGHIDFMTSSNSWNEQTNTGCIIENGNLTWTNIIINRVSPKINDNSIISDIISVNGGSAIISNNNIFSRIVINGGSPIIASNNIQSRDVGSEIEVKTGSPIISKNHRLLTTPGSSQKLGYTIEMLNAVNAYISDNFDVSIVAGSSSAIIERNQMGGIVGGSRLIIRNNTLNEITSPSPSSTITYNNIKRIVMTSSDNITATLNWWGTTDSQAINQSIYDSKYDFNLGTVTYIPFLTEPNPQAMPDPNAPLPTWPPSQSGFDWVNAAVPVVVVVVVAVVAAVFLRKRSTSKSTS